MNSESIELRHGAATVPTLVYRPAADQQARARAGRLPAVVLSPEAFGINDFTRKVASDLAGEGYVVVVPDYYRGHGLADPESYTDFAEVMAFIGSLDFGQATHDVMAAVNHARTMADVDPDRVAVWGYCTGGTLAMLTTALDRCLAASVLFFPSQPSFPECNAKRPLQPLDLMWNAACPVLLIYGDQDDLRLEFTAYEERFRHWGLNLETRIYPDAGHAFSAPVPPLRNHDADVASWADATAFLSRHMGNR